ncbi:MAG: flagellar hook capping FlgD N-terminal domain-containing protein [Pseudomonadota bacterium]
MTNIQPIASSASALNAQEPATSDVARRALTEDLDTFLTLLTKQLQNQDPLQPMDTNQFVDQLTQFSELEQGVEQSQTLEEIAASLAGDERQAEIAFLGRVVEAENETIALQNGQPARFAYEITAPTEDAEMRIFDQGGNLVARFSVEGDLGRYETSWDGRTQFGGTAAPGLYRAQVVAQSDSDQERLAGRTLSTGQVREVRFDGRTTQLILDQGQTITSDDVRRVAVPAENTAG